MAVVADSHFHPPGLPEQAAWEADRHFNDRNRAVVRWVEGADVAFTVHLGDVPHPVPGLEAHEQAMTTAREVYDALSQPLHVVAGNHDIGDSTDNPKHSKVRAYLNDAMATDDVCPAPDGAAKAHLGSNVVCCSGAPRAGASTEAADFGGLDFRHDAHGHYAWTWGPLHFVMLNEHAGGSPGSDEQPVDGPRELAAQNSLHFLSQALSVYKGEPVIVVQHFGFDPLSMGISAKSESCSRETEHWRAPVFDDGDDLVTNVVPDYVAPGTKLGLTRPVQAGGASVGAIASGAGVDLRNGRITSGNYCLTWSRSNEHAQWQTCGSVSDQKYTMWKVTDDETGAIGPDAAGNTCLFAKNSWWSADERRAFAGQLSAATASHGTTPLAIFHGHVHNPVQAAPAYWNLDSDDVTSSPPAGALSVPSMYPGQVGLNDAGFFAVRVRPSVTGGTLEVYRRVLDGGIWTWGNNGQPFATLSW
mgnify:CR=1 FL=1